MNPLGDLIRNNHFECRKKTVVFYGNCHTTGLRSILEQYEPFSEKYVILPVDAIQNIKDPSYLDHVYFRECDVFIHQSIQLNNRYGEEYASERIISNLKTDCKVISIPNVYHLPLCFFPQYEEKHEWKNKNGSTIFFRDKILDDAYRDKLSIEQTKAKYLAPDAFDRNSLYRNYELFITKVHKREIDWDIKVAQWIDQNYRDHRLFYDPNHPTTFFLMHIVRELLKILDVKVDDEQLSVIKPLKLYTYEMPIMESVRRAFKMTFPLKNIRWDGTGNFSNLSLENYIRCYWLFEWQNEELSKALRRKSKTDYDLYLIRTGVSHVREKMILKLS